MLFLRRFIKSPLNISYCRICARAFSEKQSILQRDTTDSFLKHYEEKLLYNSVIESFRLRYGYKKNAELISKRLHYMERMQTALQSVQPLPLTLKYSVEDQSSFSEELTSDSHSISDAEEVDDQIDIPTNFPYNVNTKVHDVIESQSTLKESRSQSIKSEIMAKKKLLDESEDNWMTHYENYEQDLVADNENEAYLVSESEAGKINYGTPDPNCPISTYPCGGCGAYLHCKDTAIPGYIPSEIFKNCSNPGGANFSSILCQRCHFLNEYNIALQVRVSPDDYHKVLKTIVKNSGFPVLMVDLTDFPCSIWPGIADIFGSKTPIVVVGNKVDLLPKDDRRFLARVREVLQDNLKLSGFASANIKHIELISSKTGYGVEKLISSLQRVWKRKGDVYLIGCTNVGKSSLFNLLLQSDFCKIRAVDLIQKATTSPWPGTTLNLLKFPVSRIEGARWSARQNRLQQLQKIESDQQKLHEGELKKHNTVAYATLTGRVERSMAMDTHQSAKNELLDNFSMQGSSGMSGRTKMGINEKLPEFALGKWCYDTPGVIHPDQILHLLTAEELVKTLPKELIRPETYCVKPGSSLFIAGLARLDYVEGRNSVRLTVFRANSLPITICKMSEADSVYNDLLGSELFQVPILLGDRAQKWPGLELAKNFKVFGKIVKQSSYDVVLSSAGWVAIECGLAHYEFNAWTPEKRGVYVRDSLLPKAVTLRGARIRDSVAYKRHKFI